MQRLDFSPRIRRVEHPIEKLGGFTSGTGVRHQELDDVLKLLLTGWTTTSGSFLAAEDPDGVIVGLAAHGTRTLLDPETKAVVRGFDEAPYVSLVAVVERYEGYRLPDREDWTIKDVLLEATLNEIAALNGGRPHGVWTMVGPDWPEDHELCMRHGFVLVLKASSPRAHDLRIRLP